MAATATASMIQIRRLTGLPTQSVRGSVLIMRLDPSCANKTHDDDACRCTLQAKVSRRSSDPVLRGTLSGDLS